MNLLLDTHLLLWTAITPQRLSKRARRLIEEAATQLWFSAASLWEVAIKRGLDRPDFNVDPRRLRRGLLDNGWRELAISSEHAVAILDLPPLHQDPFDRILLAQAHVEGFTLITSDRLLAQYPGHVRQV